MAATTIEPEINMKAVYKAFIYDISKKLRKSKY